MRRLLPPRLFLLCLALSVLVGWLLPLSATLPVAVRVAAGAVFALGCWLCVGAARRFDRLGANIITSDDPTAFVRDGSFAWTRNPMYLGFVLMLAAVAIAVGTLSAWIGPVVFFAVTDRWYIPFEERRMTAVFGDQYLHYRRRVMRWFGRRHTPVTT